MKVAIFVLFLILEENFHSFTIQHDVGFFFFSPSFC